MIDHEFWAELQRCYSVPANDCERLVLAWATAMLTNHKKLTVADLYDEKPRRTTSSQLTAGIFGGQDDWGRP